MSVNVKVLKSDKQVAEFPIGDDTFKDLDPENISQDEFEKILPHIFDPAKGIFTESSSAELREISFRLGDDATSPSETLLNLLNKYDSKSPNYHFDGYKKRFSISANIGGGQIADAHNGVSYGAKVEIDWIKLENALNLFGGIIGGIEGGNGWYEKNNDSFNSRADVAGVYVGGKVGGRYDFTDHVGVELSVSGNIGGANITSPDDTNSPPPDAPSAVSHGKQDTSDLRNGNSGLFTGDTTSKGQLIAYHQSGGVFDFHVNPQIDLVVKSDDCKTGFKGGIGANLGLLAGNISDTTGTSQKFLSGKFTGHVSLGGFWSGAPCRTFTDVKTLADELRKKIGGTAPEIVPEDKSKKIDDTAKKEDKNIIQILQDQLKKLATLNLSSLVKTDTKLIKTVIECDTLISKLSEAQGALQETSNIFKDIEINYADKLTAVKYGKKKGHIALSAMASENDKVLEKINAQLVAADSQKTKLSDDSGKGETLTPGKKFGDTLIKDDKVLEKIDAQKKKIDFAALKTFLVSIKKEYDALALDKLPKPESLTKDTPADQITTAKKIVTEMPGKLQAIQTKVADQSNVLSKLNKSVFESMEPITLTNKKILKNQAEIIKYLADMGKQIEADLAKITALKTVIASIKPADHADSTATRPSWISENEAKWLDADGMKPIAYIVDKDRAIIKLKKPGLTAQQIHSNIFPYKPTNQTSSVILSFAFKSKVKNQKGIEEEKDYLFTGTKIKGVFTATLTSYTENMKNGYKLSWNQVSITEAMEALTNNKGALAQAMKDDGITDEVDGFLNGNIKNNLKNSVNVTGVNQYDPKTGYYRYEQRVDFKSEAIEGFVHTEKGQMSVMGVALRIAYMTLAGADGKTSSAVDAYNPPNINSKGLKITTQPDKDRFTLKPGP